MSAKIGSIPQGLLDLFAIKNGGQNPDSLTSQLQAQIDLFGFYRLFKEQYFRLGMANQTSQGVNTAMNWSNATPVDPNNPISDGTLVRVPQNQVWIVTEYDVITNFNAIAGEGAGPIPGYAMDLGGVAEFYTPPSTGWGQNVSDAGIAVSSRWSLNDWLWLPSGARLVAVNARPLTTASNLSVHGRIRLLRLLA